METERSTSRSSTRRTVTASIAVAVALALFGLIQSFRLVEQGWYRHEDVTPHEIFSRNSDAATTEATDLPFLNASNDAAVRSENNKVAVHTDETFFSTSPRDYVLPYPEKARLHEGDMAALSVNRVIHVLSHTHWDREWYLSLEQFRGSLIIELDRVFDMLTNVSYNFHHFHMDGQYLMVEDYLEVRPSMRQTIAGLNRNGKLTLGPFYSQPDVFLSSGEALIRNLMLGMSLSSDLGGTSTVGYLADTFGFIGQMPQLLRGVGIHSFVSGRFAKTTSSEGHWVGPDGSTVLFASLKNWYCHAIDSLRSPKLTLQQGKAVLTKLDSDLTRAGAMSKHRLAMHGCDHFMTDSEVGTKLEIINESSKNLGIQIVQTNVDDYMRLIEADLADEVKLPTVKGEVREGVDMLINSASTKMSVKQQNFKLQSLLEKWVEPMEAYGWALGGRKYDADRIWHAWKPVLQTHAHDSICSTSASSVIHDIVNRLSRAEQSAYRIIADQAGQVVPAILSIRQLGFDRRGQVLVVNPTNTARSECITFTLVSSARSTGKYKGFKDLLSEMPTSAKPLVLASESGRQKESFELPNTQFRKVTRKSSATYLAQIHLSPNGIALLELVEEDATLPQGHFIAERSVEETATMENKYFSVVVDMNDGSCFLTHTESGQTFSNVNKLWRTTEVGSTYLHKAGGRPEYVSGLRIASKNHSFLFSSIQLEGKLGASDISITYVLFVNAKSLQIETSIDNSERNNYVVTSFPVRKTGGSGLVNVDVDGNFEYINRSKMTNRYVHQNRFTSMYSAGSSLTVANRGIPEYKVTSEGTMEMTLLRGVQKIGDWIAGPLEDDISQELGMMTFQYAVIPDTCRVTDPSCMADLEARNFVDPIGSFASWVPDGYRPERYIDMDVSPLSVVSALSTGTKTEDEEQPQLDDEILESVGAMQMFDLKPAKLILSAVKKAESKEALVVRVYNPTNQSLQASLSPGLVKFSRVESVLLNENRMEEKKELPIRQGENEEFNFTVAAYKIVTLLLFKQ